MEDFLNSDLGKLSIPIGIILLTILLAWLFDRFARRYINKTSEHLANDPTNYKFLRHMISALIYLIGFSLAIYSIPSLRTVAQSLLAGAGILAVAVGFASQAALSNVVAGIFIVMFKPFRVNDRIILQNQLSGMVEDITLRHTVIRNFENRRIIIPNSVISEEIITNSDFDDGRICKWVELGISYDSDIQLAKQIMMEEAVAHPLSLDNRSEEDIADGRPAVMVRVITLGDFAITLRAWVWAKDTADAFVISCDLFESVKARFDREGIEIPYPHRTIVQKSPIVKG